MIKPEDHLEAVKSIQHVAAGDPASLITFLRMLRSMGAASISSAGNATPMSVLSSAAVILVAEASGLDFGGEQKGVESN